MGIIRSSDANTLDVIAKVKEKVNLLQASLPNNMKIFTALSNEKSIKITVDSLVEAIFYGLILSCLVVYLFLD